MDPNVEALRHNLAVAEARLACAQVEHAEAHEALIRLVHGQQVDQMLAGPLAGLNARYVVGTCWAFDIDGARLYLRVQDPAGEVWEAECPYPAGETVCCQGATPEAAIAKVRDTLYQRIEALHDVLSRLGRKS